MCKSNTKKIIIAGVGGQGVVYLTNLIVGTALLADIAVATSEIHGLSQRSGSVMAGITFGEKSYGFIEEGGVDFLLGLESLEAQRCVRYLNRKSQAVIDNRQILPYSVNSGKAAYPDITSFIKYLEQNIAQVIFNREFDRTLDPVVRNIYILGIVSRLDHFPLAGKYIEQAIKNTAKERYKTVSIRALRQGRAKGVESIRKHEYSA